MKSIIIFELGGTPEFFILQMFLQIRRANVNRGEKEEYNPRYETNQRKIPFSWKKMDDSSLQMFVMKR